VRHLPRYVNPAPRNPSRTSPGVDALASLRPRHPEEARFPAATAADRLNQGPQPPHETPVSDERWWGDQSARANLGSNPTLRQISDSHAYVDVYGEGHHCHHLIDRGVVGPASTQACTEHVAALHQGRTRVPAEHQAATRAHLVRHLRDGNVPVPEPDVPPHLSGRAAQNQLEEMTIADRIADRRERLADLQDAEAYYDARERMNDR